jgi:hypothetical protein
MSVRPAITVIFLLCVIAVMAVSPSIAVAQDDPTQTPTPTATPTVTPTPADQYRVTLGSGAELVVERRITYGDIAIVLVLLVMLVGASLYGIIRLIRLWLF